MQKSGDGTAAAAVAATVAVGVDAVFGRMAAWKISSCNFIALV